MPTTTPPATTPPTTAPDPVAVANAAPVKLTFNQIETLWIANGGDPAWAPTMAAIAWFESEGNVTALNNNPSTQDFSVGLWQINYFGGLNSSRTAEYGSSGTLQNNPNAQAKAAIALLGNGAGLSNWQGDPAGNVALASFRQKGVLGIPTFAQAVALVPSSSGSFLTGASEPGTPAVPVDPGAAQAANPFPGPLGAIAGLATGGTSVPSTSSGWLGELGTILGDFTSAAWWKRVGIFTLGGVLVLGGVILFVTTTKTGQRVESDAAVAAAA